MRRTRAWARPVATLVTALATLLGPALTAPGAAAAVSATVATAPDTTVSATAPDADGSAAANGRTPDAPTPRSTPTASADTSGKVSLAAPVTDLAVEITDIGPAIIGPDQTLTVRGTVANATEEDVASPVVLLRMQRSTPISRSTLQRWLEPDSLFSTVVLARQELPTALPAGATATFSIDVAPQELPLAADGSSWGPRGIEVAVSDASGAASVDGQDRSFLLWYPDIEVEPTPVGVLAPVAPTAAERSQALDEGGDVATAAAPRLVPLLSALNQPGVTVAVDGMLLSAPGGNGAAAPPDTGNPDAPTAAATPPAPAAGEAAPGAPPDAGWAGLLGAVTTLTRASDREVVALPWADADVAALAHAGREDLLVSAVERSAATAAAAGLDVRSDIAWPAASLPDQATVDLAAATGAAAVVLPATSMTPEQALTYTPAGRAELPVGEDDEGEDEDTLPAILVDERASAVLSGQLLPRLNAADGDIAHLDALTVRQLLLADTAVIARERPNDPRPLMLSLPRGFDGSTESLSAALTALASAPWVEPTTISDLATLDAPTLERSPLPEEEVAGGELGTGLLTRMRATLNRAESFGAITADAQGMAAPYATALAGALSVSWRQDPSGRAELVEAVAAAVSGLDAAVTALPSSTLNLINSSTQIPVNVRNDLTVDVTVQVVLEPTDQRLQAPGPVALTVPASSQATAHVQVQAVGSGDLPVAVELLTPEGRAVGTPTELQVRVRADWENVGTALVAAVLVVMLIAGIVRTVRRGPRMEPGAMPDAEE